MEPSPLPLWLLPLILVSFVGVFAGIWSLICVILALASGWFGMARRYAAPAGMQGNPLSSGYANRVGLTSYQGILSFEAHEQGLIVRVVRLFPFHQPLLLPWGATQLRAERGMFSAGVLAVEGGGTFTLNQDAFRSIERARSEAAAIGRGPIA